MGTGADDQGGTVVASAWVGSGATPHALGCLVALAIIPAVAVGVNLVAGDQLPRELEGSTPYFVAAAVLLGAASAWVYLRSRKRAELVRTGDVLAIRVDGQELARSPFQLAYGYQVQKVHRAPATTVLILGVIVDGRCAVSFIEEWGAAYAAPSWPNGWPALPGPAARSFRILAGRKFVTEIVDQAGR
jgi:hypothetical protein